MWKCLECGRRFRTVKAAERAANNGCPHCGGVDIDLDVDTKRTVFRPCSCGSGLESEEVCDARGIYICRVCDRCRDTKLRGYRPEVLTDPHYEADEPIEPDGPGLEDQ
jgi:hypothetical protein